MNYNIYFSPTGSTKKVTTFIANHFQNSQDIDISLPVHQIIEMNKADFCIVGVPSFGGRVPFIVSERLKNIKGDQTPVLLVVTYGNRAYDDTLLELKETMEKSGFCVIGAYTIVTEHSIMHQFATGRPTQEDLKDIETHIEEVKARLQKENVSIKVPGHKPYKEYNGIPLKPKTSKECNQCGICAKQCPVQAIPVDKPNTTIEDICISCMRCVKICPQHARKCSSLKISISSQKLKKVCSIKKDNEFF